MEEAIGKYGREEWRLVVLTSELHGHLGIYAILGAKMGLFAREYLKAGLDDLFIVSEAGTKPPVSCLNDGLQVSTGATLGHGLISIKSSRSAKPAADFTFGGRTVSIALIENLAREIEGVLEETLKSSGGLTAEYWLKVRELALFYWLKYDRHKIFDVIRPEEENIH